MISRSLVSKPSEQRARSGGFTLVEIVVAIIVLVIGVLGVAGIMGSTVQLQRLTSSRAEITTLAETKFEELRAYGMTASTDPLRAKLAVGGSTTVPTNDYADTVANVRGKAYTRAWAISDDVVGTRRVTLRVYPVVRTRNDMKWLEFTSLVWLR